MILSGSSGMVRLLIIMAVTLLSGQKAKAFDINFVGLVNDLNSLSRHTTSFIDALNGQANIKLIQTRECNFSKLPAYYKNIVICEGAQEAPLTGMTIFTDALWFNWKKYASFKNQSIIKYAYCVAEKTLIPQKFAQRLNQNFDGVIVADEWLVDVYKNSGVNLPIFVLPEILDLDSLLQRQQKRKATRPFVFGCSSGFWPRKNQKLLMQAFIDEFGENEDVVLKIHSRFSDDMFGIKKSLESIKKRNIQIIVKAFSRNEYENFLTSLDCYVTISKAEGFSIVPREALAAQIPCIVSDNTAQSTICKSGCVYSVPSNIAEPSYSVLVRKFLGHEFNCLKCDVRKALRTVYNNYEKYLSLAQQGREWVKQYTLENMKEHYQSLIFPKEIILGDSNSFSNGCLVTNSEALFEKCKQLYDLEKTVFSKVKQ